MNHAVFHGGWYSVVAIVIAIAATAKGTAAKPSQKPALSCRFLEPTPQESRASRKYAKGAARSSPAAQPGQPRALRRRDLTARYRPSYSPNPGMSCPVP